MRENERKFKPVLILLLGIFFYFYSLAFAEVITLKSGRKIEGKIIEKTQEHIKIDVFGVPLVYYYDQIEDVEEDINQEPSSSFKEANTSSYSKDPQTIFKDMSPAVVYIVKRAATGEEYLGSGFVIDKDGVVVTNYHVIHSAQEVNIKLKDGGIYPVTSLIYYDFNRDICVLKINAKNLPAVSLGDSSLVQIGERVYCIGNPIGLEYSFSDGLLSGIRDSNGIKWLQFTAPASMGNSGGPLIDNQGKVIGMVTYLIQGAQNISFALAINEIKPFLTTNKEIDFKEFVKNISQAEYYFMQGNNFYFQNDINQAVAYLKKSIEINPYFVEGYGFLGHIHYSLGQYDQAINYCQKAIQLNPNYIPAYNDIASVYYSLADYWQAIDYLKKAIQIDPSFATAYSNLGATYNTLFQPQQAILYLQKAIQLNPDYVEAYYHLGVAHNSLEQYNQAISYFQKAIELKPDDYITYNEMALSYGYLGQYEQAITCYQKAIQLNPNDATAYNNLGFIYYSLSKHQEAITCYQKAIQIEPMNAGVHNSLGCVYAAIGQYEYAREHFQKAKELFQAGGDSENIKLAQENLNKLSSISLGGNNRFSFFNKKEFNRGQDVPYGASENSEYIPEYQKTALAEQKEDNIFKSFLALIRDTCSFIKNPSEESFRVFLYRGGSYRGILFDIVFIIFVYPVIFLYTKILSMKPPLAIFLFGVWFIVKGLEHFFVLFLASNIWQGPIFLQFPILFLSGLLFILSGFGLLHLKKIARTVLIWHNIIGISSRILFALLGGYVANTISEELITIIVFIFFYFVVTKSDFEEGSADA